MTLKIDAQQGLIRTVTLPRQEGMDESQDFAFDEATVIIFHRGKDHGALDNALSLLETLYAYGVTNPRVLQMILTATGQRKAADPLTSNNSAPAQADQRG